jgi:hypothetical protein
VDGLTAIAPAMKRSRVVTLPATAKSAVDAGLAFIVSIVAPCFFCVAAVVAAPVPATLEYQVKASYLYNFMRFVSWPEQGLPRDGTFNLCVVGASRFGSGLDALAGEPVDGRSIAVHKLPSVADARSARCQLLFAADVDGGSPVINEWGLLTVGETPGFLERGGIINLVEVQGRIRFEINQEAAKRAGLTMSSRLLRLAMEPR